MKENYDRRIQRYAASIDKWMTRTLAVVLVVIGVIGLVDVMVRQNMAGLFVVAIAAAGLVMLSHWRSIVPQEEEDSSK